MPPSPYMESTEFSNETNAKLRGVLAQLSPEELYNTKNMIQKWQTERPLRPWEEGKFVIETILAQRKTVFGIYCLVKWKDFPLSKTTWEPLEMLPKGIVEPFEERFSS